MKAKYKIGETVFSKVGGKYGVIIQIHYANGNIYYRIKFSDGTAPVLFEESNVLIEKNGPAAENVDFEITSEGDNVRVKMYIQGEEQANISAPRENKTIKKTIESAINALVTLSNITVHTVQEAENEL